ncbi:MbcA/ParS/Xre antitoxin family protein, partial [Rubellimicrobium roseum]
QKHSAAETKTVALKAFSYIISEWQIPIPEAAALADMSESTWKRARRAGYTGDLTHDQLLRLSAVVGIYKALKLYFSDPIARRWITLPNDGPLFNGERPIDTMIREGLPQFLQVRTYLDALRGGA